MAYKYKSLSSEHNEIRILKLLPPTYDEPTKLCCELETVSLNANPRYSALSYCWVDPRAPEPRLISLHDYNTKVTGNLYAALLALRDETEAKFWWVDALCINQEDFEERSLQVLRMTVIYRTAFQVVAWIGSQDLGSPSLKKHLDATTQLLESKPETPLSVGHFYDLLSRKYWRRMWIVQEISVATEIWIVSGSSWVKWDSLCKVIDLYEKQQQKDPRFDKPTEDNDGSHLLDSSLADPAHNLSALQLVTTSTDDDLASSYRGLKTFRDFRLRIAKQVPIGFIEALGRTSPFLATDDRDKFYALLGLVYDGRAFTPTPDYRIPFEELQVQMGRNFLQATKNLDIIISPGQRHVLDGSSPSWCPDWLHLGLEAEYAFSRDTTRKFYASGDSTFIPITDNQTSSWCIVVECLIFEQVDGLSTVYGQPSSSSEPLIQSVAHQPSSKDDSKELRRKLQRALISCFASGYSLDANSTIDPYRVRQMSRRVWGRRELSMYLWVYYGTVTAEAPWYRQFLAVFQAKRKFDTPELSLWLEQNRNLLIHGQPLESLCKSRTNRTILPPTWHPLMTMLVAGCVSIILWPTCGVFIMDPKLAGTTLKRIPALVLTFISLPCVLLIVFKVSSFNNDAMTLQAKALRRLDRDIKKKSHSLRLAVTGGGPESFDLGGLPAIVPGSARQGDQFAILKGCSVPVLLREHQDGYRVVGIAVLPGVMDGELMDQPLTSWKECRLY